jgi:hypothetical protein
METDKVIGGWVNKRFKGDHAAFLAAYRKQLGFMRGFGIVLVFGMGAIAFIEFNDGDEANAAVKAGSAVIWGAVALVANHCRNKLDAARAAGRIPVAAKPAA